MIMIPVGKRRKRDEGALKTRYPGHSHSKKGSLLRKLLQNQSSLLLSMVEENKLTYLQNLTDILLLPYKFKSDCQ